VVDRFTMRVLGKLESALDGVAPPSGVEHVVLVDARLWQNSHAEIEAHLRPNAAAVYIARPCEIAIYLSKLTPEQCAAIKSWNLLFHGSPYDADKKPIHKDDPTLADRAVSIEVLGAQLSVLDRDVDAVIGVTPESTDADRAQSRKDHPEYWELRDAMVLLWEATKTQQAPFYLYACNLAKIRGFQRLFTGFQRPVYGSTDVTGPNTNWRVEWESESGKVTPGDMAHAETNVFVRPGQMKLELPWPPSFGQTLQFLQMYNVAKNNLEAAARAEDANKRAREQGWFKVNGRAVVRRHDEIKAPGSLTPVCTVTSVKGAWLKDGRLEILYTLAGTGDDTLLRKEETLRAPYPGEVEKWDNRPVIPSIDQFITNYNGFSTQDQAGKVWRKTADGWE